MEIIAEELFLKEPKAGVAGGHALPLHPLAMVGFLQRADEETENKLVIEE